MQLSVYPFNTLQICYKHIEDIHEERTRVDKAHIWPQILSKASNLYHIDIFLIIERHHACVRENMFKISIMHPGLPW